MQVKLLHLIGANGSGKSTMSKVINGVVVLDGGQLSLDDKPVHFSSPQAAKKLGISTVFQELSLIPQMSIADNIWLTREPLNPIGMVDRKAVREKTEELACSFSPEPIKPTYIRMCQSLPCHRMKSRSLKF